MRELAAALSAQLGAELRTRLRSSGTFIAVLAILAGSYFWIPEPGSKVASISWIAPDGSTHSPLFDASYVGTAATILAVIFLTLVGFYLVAGSVRRDRERGIGAILAATPVSNDAYLAGKLAAHAAYLGVLTLVILAVAFARFLWFGQGSFDAGAFLGPFLLITPPAVIFVAALSVVFDVTPGLGGRAGLVLWFFAAMIFMIGLPSLTGFDPIGMATLERMIVAAIPEHSGGVSTGLIVHDHPIARVPWGGLAITGKLVAARLGALLGSFPALAFAVLVFDRFDPARQKLAKRRPQRSVASPAPEPTAPPSSLAALPAVKSRPTLNAALCAEARLTWDLGGWLRWPLVASSLLAAILPAAAAQGAAAVFLLLLAPVIAEAAARDSLAGADPLVHSQPAVPRTIVLWKAASLALFLVALGLPHALRSFVEAPLGVVAFLSGLVFTACLATAAGTLTGNGKLYSGLYLGLWYASVNHIEALDYCGIFVGDRRLSTSLVYLVPAAACLAVAFVHERINERLD